MSRNATARKSNASAGGFPASLNSLVIREKGGGGSAGDSMAGGGSTSHRRVRLVDGVGRGGRTAPEPPPSSRQTSLEEYYMFITYITILLQDLMDFFSCSFII